MSYWVVQSFAVENPRERLQTLRSRLTLADDFANVVDTGPADPGDRVPDVQYEVIALTTSRLRQPDMASAYAIKSDDETLFGPFMQAVLEPGESGCVLGVNDTSDAGSGHVYRKGADGEVTIVDRVSDDGDARGEAAASECARQYGFRPFTEPQSSLEHLAREHDDPIVRYRELTTIEAVLADELRCEDCGSTAVSEDRDRNLDRVYEAQYRCEDCDEVFRAYHLHELPSPREDCQHCGGSFEERDVQYPALGSTAFECDGCGFVTFDTLSLPDADLAPDGTRSDPIAPDAAAYRSEHGLE
ncbi:hypothetical protein [Haloarchaeobius iranensis]|uniref:Uncharacterized protein n=1 Tax=Haloarchaeobius iranensis TaxID=996166 RepID=A0A1G9TZI8_9EURY|nr:hypothetical protein [Haloarchaeobius iranensis]SDM52685.1 hypothetical protein SAMN05192554_103200 [Haloarchaeobius iranensis]